MFRERKYRDPGIPEQQADFDFSPFYKKFPILNADTSNKDLISATFVPYVKRLLEQGRIGSAENYQDTYNSLVRFKGNVRFIDITVNYLYRYEQWMIGRGRSKTTVGISFGHSGLFLMRQLSATLLTVDIILSDGGGICAQLRGMSKNPWIYRQ